MNDKIAVLMIIAVCAILGFVGGSDAQHEEEQAAIYQEMLDLERAYQEGRGND